MSRFNPVWSRRLRPIGVLGLPPPCLRSRADRPHRWRTEDQIHIDAGSPSRKGLNCDPHDAVCDVIIADKGATRIVVRSMSEADVRAIAADPSALVGSDGPCVAPYGITGQGKPHPRLYGTFPRLIGHYARDLGLLTLPQAIAKMTGGAAAALGLADRDAGPASLAQAIKAIIALLGRIQGARCAGSRQAL